MNGMRQPQVLKSASGSIVTRENIAEAETRPMGKPTCTRLPKNPRRCDGACSRTINDAPPHSPPSAMPCDDAQHHQQHRRQNSDLGVGRQHANRGCRQPHADHGQHQHRLAAHPVAEMAEHRAADRTRQESDRECAQCGEGADPRIDVGKEQPVEHQGGGGSVDQEVVPFDDGAEGAGEGDGAHAMRLDPPMEASSCSWS